MAEEKKSFEQRIARLGEIVAKMEGETLPLEQSMAYYEEGKKLIESLQADLKEAEELVEKSLKGKQEN